MSGTFRSLKTHNMRVYMFGLLVSNIGTWLQVAATALIVYKINHKATDSGINAMFEFAPMLLLGAWAGGIADKFNRRRIMFFTQSAMALQATALAIVCATNSVSLPVMYSLSVVLGVASAIDNPSRRGLVMEIVPQQDLSNAMALNSMTLALARVLGPALAAFLIGPFGATWLFSINAISYGAVLASISFLRKEEMIPPAVAPRGGKPVREALAFVKGNKPIRSLFIVFAVSSTFGVNFSTVLPKMADKLWGHANGYAVLMALVSFGSFLGAMNTARMKSVKVSHFVSFAALMSLACIAVPQAPNFYVACLLVVPLGFGMTGYLTSANAISVLRAPAEMRSRVLALQTVIFLGSTPIGGPLTGWIGDNIGIKWSMVYGGVLTLMVLPLMRGSE